MTRFEVDFIDITGGWYTYDIYAYSVFDAAAALSHCASIKRITNIVVA